MGRQGLALVRGVILALLFAVALPSGRVGPALADEHPGDDFFDPVAYAKDVLARAQLALYNANVVLGRWEAAQSAAQTQVNWDENSTAWDKGLTLHGNNLLAPPGVDLLPEVPDVPTYKNDLAVLQFAKAAADRARAAVAAAQTAVDQAQAQLDAAQSGGGDGNSQ